MKKIIFIISLITLFSCNEKEKNNEKPSRIKFIESKKVGSYQVGIIEVDDVEYLSTSRGGLIKLEKNENL